MPKSLNEFSSEDFLKPVFMFSGQGSQKVGMGSDMLEDPLIEETFECASDIFGFNILSTMVEGSPELLNKTLCAQAALVSMSIALTRKLEEAGIKPGACLGFSLGQVSALYASSMFSFEEVFCFAKLRAEAMEQAAHAFPGAMCALLGADEGLVQGLCEEHAMDDTLVIANYNCPGQIVISGNQSAIARAQEAWAAAKKRSVLLATAGAFHSPLMEQAAGEVKRYLQNQIANEASPPLICNVDAQVLSAKNVTEHLSRHLTHPVKFQQSVQNLAQVGAQVFVEIGYGGVLSGLVKRIDKSLYRTSIDSLASLNTFLEQERGRR